MGLNTYSFILLLHFSALFHVTLSLETVRWHSQHLQDQFVMSKIFNNKTNGYFIELGAADGLLMSNTISLEKYFNWNGICIEPSSVYKKLVLSNRTCVKRGDLIGHPSGDVVEFIEQLSDGENEIAKNNDFNYVNQGTIKFEATDNKLLSGMKKHLSSSHAFVGSKILKVVRTLSDILDESNAPNYVDFLSLDTEGSEFEILEHFPFSHREFGAMAIEHNYNNSRRTAIKNLLEKNGYVWINCVNTDDIYVNVKLMLKQNDIKVDTRMCMGTLIEYTCDPNDIANVCKGIEQGELSFVENDKEIINGLLKDIKDSGYTIPQVCNMLKAHCQQITKTQKHDVMIPLIMSSGPKIEVEVGDSYRESTVIQFSSPDTIEEAKQFVKDLQLNERDGDSFVASAVEIVRNYIDKETKENIEKVLLLSATAAGQAK